MKRRSFVGALLGTLVAIVATPLERFLEGGRVVLPSLPVDRSSVVHTEVSASSVNDAMRIIYEDVIVDGLVRDTELLSAIYEEKERRRSEAEPARYLELRRGP